MKIEIVFGIEKDSKGASLDPLMVMAALRAIRHDAAKTFGGYTETSTVGGWIDSQETLVEEAGRKLEIYADTASYEMEVKARKAALELAGYIREKLLQQAVVLVMDGQHMMVEGKVL